MHEDLIDQGVLVSRKRVVRLMRAEGLRGRMQKRVKQTTMSEDDQPVATNVLAQEFGANAPNQRWVADTTEFVIGSSGKLDLAAVLDLYSRFLVSWAVSAVNDRPRGSFIIPTRRVRTRVKTTRTCSLGTA